MAEDYQSEREDPTKELGRENDVFVIALCCPIVYDVYQLLKDSIRNLNMHRTSIFTNTKEIRKWQTA